MLTIFSTPKNFEGMFDIIQTNAINSSLWEIEALQKHPNPSVSTLAKRFNLSFSKKPYNMNNFCCKVS